MGSRLMAVVAEGHRGRVFLPPTPEMEALAHTAQPKWKPEGDIPSKHLDSGYKNMECRNSALSSPNASWSR